MGGAGSVTLEVVLNRPETAMSRSALLGLLALVARYPDPARADEAVQSAVAHDGHLLCLYYSEAVAAWNVQTGAFAPDVATRYTRKGLLYMAAAGDTLWAADKTAVYKWAGQPG